MMCAHCSWLSTPQVALLHTQPAIRFMIEAETIVNDGAKWIGRTDAGSHRRNRSTPLLRLWPLLMAWGFAA